MVPPVSRLTSSALSCPVGSFSASVPGQPMNFRAEAKTETSIVLSWSPPRQEIIVKYELLYKEGDHSREVSLERSSAKGWGPEDHPIPALCFLSWLREGSVGQVSQGRARLCSFLFVFIFFLPPRPSQVLRNFEPTTSFTVEGLKPNTEYVFRLAARSALGLGAFTPEVRERTLQSSRCLSFSHPSLRGRQSGSQRWWAQGYGAVGQMVAVPRGFTHLGLLCGEVGGAGRLWDLAPSPFTPS